MGVIAVARTLFPAAFAPKEPNGHWKGAKLDQLDGLLLSLSKRTVTIFQGSIARVLVGLWRVGKGLAWVWVLARRRAGEE